MSRELVWKMYFEIARLEDRVAELCALVQEELEPRSGDAESDSHPTSRTPTGLCGSPSLGGVSMLVTGSPLGGNRSPTPTSISPHSRSGGSVRTVVAPAALDLASALATVLPSFSPAPLLAARCV